MLHDRGLKATRRSPVFALAAVAAVSAFLLVACGAGGTETVTRTFEVGDSPRLVVGAGHGEVLVQTGVPGEIVVHAVVEATANVTLEVEADGDEVTARSTTTSSGNLFGDTAQGNVSFTITVPEQTEIEIGTGSGPVTVSGVQRGGAISASAGTVTLSGVAGEFSGGTGVGDVRISGSEGQFEFTVGVGDIDFAGTLRTGSSNQLETGVGNVNVAIEEGAQIELSAETQVGALESSVGFDDESLNSTISGWSLTAARENPDVALDIRVGTGSILLSAAN